jgi:hypothetical protein
LRLMASEMATTLVPNPIFHHIGALAIRPRLLAI